MRATNSRTWFFRCASLLLPTFLCVIGASATFANGAAPSATPEQLDALAQSLVERAGVRRGLCAVVGDDRNLALQLADWSELVVYVREPQAAAATELRKRAVAAGYGIDRLVVEQGRTDNLPFVDNMVDVVISTQVDAAGLAELSAAEVLRVLRPGGKAIFGNAGVGQVPEEAELRKWSQQSDADGIELWEDASGRWVQFTKPALEGADDWSHWEHGPDNNPVSSDQIIKAPYMTQFLAEPYYIGMPSVTTAAGGRTFLAIGHIAHHRREWDGLNRIIARNGYNGTVLWERKLPEGYMVHRSAFIATKDTFYMMNGDHCLLLDPQTGDEQGRLRLPGIRGEWKWMVMRDGMLYVLAGRKDPGAKTMLGDRSYGGWSWGDLSQGYYGKPHVPWGFGRTLTAYDMDKKKVVWKHDEENPIDSRAMSMGKDRVSLYCPGHYLRGLNVNNGEVLWTNEDRKVLDLIEEPGKDLRSTPGFRTACLTVFTPDALIIQGQTRMNVVAVSPADGYLLWSKKKITNNPNAIFVDGKVVLGVGEGGRHVVVEPSTGNVVEDLKFHKTACTRLTASTDSFFCRGEGMLRFDRKSKQLLIDGAARPACNDGAIPANGLLYIGPWQCDCNLSLVGRMARCSAGDFRFDHTATEAEHLELVADDQTVQDFPLSDADWPTFRGDNQRSASTPVRVAGGDVSRTWEFSPEVSYLPSVPTAAGGLVFVSGHDGTVRAIDAENGALRWAYQTPSPIRMPPTISDGRAYVGSSDGFVYALEAATGRLLWRFRAAPTERHIMVYGNLTSTWPVNSGVLVHEGVAYVAAGIIDHDGTYVYALDSATGRIIWQNSSSGHLNETLRKGVSAQGNLTIQGDQLLLAGGNQVSPARFELATGKCLNGSFEQGKPKSNNGQFVGVFQDRQVIAGGRILFSASKNVATKGSFSAFNGSDDFTLCYGGIAPAWNDSLIAMVNYQFGMLGCYDADSVAKRIDEGYLLDEKGNRLGRTLSEGLDREEAIRWQTDLGDAVTQQALSLAVCPNAVVAVVERLRRSSAHPRRHVVAYSTDDGRPLWREQLRGGEPLPGGLLIDREGRAIVTMLDGRVQSFGPSEPSE